MTFRLESLAHVLADILRQLKHGCGTLATEKSFELVVGIDVALVLRVLETMLLDVVPDALGDFTAGLGSGSHDGRQNCVGLYWFQESWVCFTC